MAKNLKALWAFAEAGDLPKLSEALGRLKRDTSLAKFDRATALIMVIEMGHLNAKPALDALNLAPTELAALHWDLAEMLLEQGGMSANLERVEGHLRKSLAFVGGLAGGASIVASARENHPAAAKLFDDVFGVMRHLAGGEETAPSMVLGEHELRFGHRTLVMGILNVTPDSFSDGGQFVEPAKAIDHGVELASLGADLLDVGGESTRPGAPEVSEEDELARVIPVIAGLVRQCPGVPISIDTSKMMVAQGAIDAGAVLVNDVTGLRDPAMAELVRCTGVAACVMHMRGTPKTMQARAQYADVVTEVIAELHLAIERSGVDRSRLLVDPGIGFAKDIGHNLTLLKNLEALRVLGLPIVLGTSRKSFLGTLSGVKNPAERVMASVASVALAAATGAVDVVRVHDVAATRQALAVADAIRSS